MKILTKFSYLSVGLLKHGFKTYQIYAMANHKRMNTSKIYSYIKFNEND